MSKTIDLICESKTGTFLLARLQLMRWRTLYFGSDSCWECQRIFEEIGAALSRGDRVELRGFGAFSVKERNARIGRNPRTGESVQVDAKRVPFFKTGKELRDRLNDDG